MIRPGGPKSMGGPNFSGGPRTTLHTMETIVSGRRHLQGVWEVTKFW